MFKIGDIVRGLKNEEYGITNEEMLKAKILNVYEDVKKVKVEILEHKESYYRGHTYTIEWKVLELINNENKKENETIVDDIYRVLDNTGARKADLIERISYNEREVKKAWREIALRRNDLTNLKRDLEMLQTINIEETKNKVKTHIDNILSLPQVKKLDTYGSDLYIYTNRIDFYDTQGNKFRGNHYKIEMNIKTGALRFETPYAESNLHYSYWDEGDEISPHPHIGRPGEYCLGNAGDLLCEYISEQDLFNSVLVVIAFLEQCNEEDYAGKWVSEWTCIDEEGNEIENPYDKHRNMCSICDERLTEDETYYCYECDAPICDEHAWSIGDGDYVCESCADEYYTRCSICDVLHRNEDVTECADCGDYVCNNCERWAGEDTFCSDHCRDEQYTFCNGCDEYKPNDDMVDCAYCEESYCISCMTKAHDKYFCDEECKANWEDANLETVNYEE